MQKPITAVLFGAGLRGAEAYAPYALNHPDALKFVAVAEPDDVRRIRFAAAHNIPRERQFVSWEDVVARPQMADVVFNCTMDQMHYASGMAALAVGYDMLLEKPMAASVAECDELIATAEQKNLRLMVDHTFIYNGAVRNLNVQVESFPSNLVANQFNFEKAEFFELENPEERAVPKVSF